jgi:hypothetical protein
MSETQTDKQDPNEVVYDSDGKRIDDKNRTEDDPDFDNPFVRTPEERAAPDPVATEEDTEDEFTPQAARRARRITPGRVVAGAAVAGALVVGGAGFANMAGGNDNGAERGEVAEDIFSVTLSPDANLRYDPNLGDENHNTLIGQPGEETVVVGQSRIRVLESASDGTWYGLSSSWLADSIPNFNDGGDKDGIIWVNEQGVTHVTHLEDVDIQLPDTPAYEDDSKTTNP